MSEGQVLCIGSAAELEETYFNFYQVILKLVVPANETQASAVAQYVSEHTLPGSSVLEHFERCLSFKWTREQANDASVGNAIRRLIDLKSHAFDGRLLVESFAIRHSSLDQVFLNVSKKKNSRKRLRLPNRPTRSDAKTQIDDVATLATADTSHMSDRLYI